MLLLKNTIQDQSIVALNLAKYQEYLSKIDLIKKGLFDLEIILNKSIKQIDKMVYNYMDLVMKKSEL